MFYIFFLIYSILEDIKSLTNEIDKKERWQSGLMHWSWKPARGQLLREFESPSLRHCQVFYSLIKPMFLIETIFAHTFAHTT